MSNALRTPERGFEPQQDDKFELMIVGSSGEPVEVSAAQLFGALFRPAPVHEFDPRATIKPSSTTDGQGVEKTAVI